MSFGRNTNTRLIQGVLKQFQSPLSLMCLVMVTLQEAAAADTNDVTLYMRQGITEAYRHYRLQFSSAQFDQATLKNNLQQICRFGADAKLEEDPGVSFAHSATPTCVYGGAAIDLSVQVGQELTEMFRDCLNKVLEKTCPQKSYFTTQNIMLGVGFLLMVALVSLCVCGYQSCRNGNNQRRDRAYVALDDAPEPPVVVIHSHDEHHHDHHHHHDHDHSHASAEKPKESSNVIWNP